MYIYIYIRAGVVGAMSGRAKISLHRGALIALQVANSGFGASREKISPH